MNLKASLLVCAVVCIGQTAQCQFDYEIDGGIVIITGYSGTGGSVAIPTSIDGLPVTTIGINAFDGDNSITSITIPSGITNIEPGAFFACTSLAAITVSSQNSFYTISDGVLFDYALTTVIQYPPGRSGIYYTIPNGVRTIANGAFAYCHHLINVNIPKSVTNIGNEAFDQCGSLTGVLIPNGVTSIGGNAFYASALSSVTIPGSVTNLSGSPFEYCGSLTNVTIAEGVNSIGNYAFFECRNLVNITIAGSVTNLDYDAFYQCVKLAGVYFIGNAPVSDPSAFASDTNAAVYYLPGTAGWAGFSTNTGVPSILWNPQIQTGVTGFGVQSNQFGFNITGTAYINVVVEASTNLAAGSWLPLQTVTLTSGSAYFSEPLQANGLGRFYRLSPP
jgi:hypothetical protein